MKPDAGMNKNDQKLEQQQQQEEQQHQQQQPPQPSSQHLQHPQNLSLAERLNTYSYGQAREIIVKEMRANQEAINRLEARVETLAAILRQAGVELPPFPSFPSVKD